MKLAALLALLLAAGACEDPVTARKRREEEKMKAMHDEQLAAKQMHERKRADDLRKTIDEMSVKLKALETAYDAATDDLERVKLRAEREALEQRLAQARDDARTLQAP